MRRASLVIILIGLVLIPGSRAFADGWPDVGSAKRPAWVDAAAERRLRLLSALPALQNTLHSEANAYFGSAGPGLSVGLVLDDGLYYSRGFGFADAQRTVVPDEHTIYRAGSLSKVMTGTALLTLIDDDLPNSPKMTLFDAADEQRYLPELKSVCPVFNKNCARGSQSLGITLANLVSHTSGLPDVMEQGNASVAAWLTDLQKSWLLFKPANPSNPGNLSAYSGVGIEGVGLIEQRISHKPYVDFVTQNLFLPLGMKHSSMDQTKLPGSLQAQKWMFSVSEKDPCKASCMTQEQLCMQDAHSGPERGACAKAQLNCTGKCPPPKSSYSFAQFDGMIGGDDQPMIAPAGGLATSVEDLGLFIKMWLSATAPTVNGHPLLKKKTIQDAATPLFTTVGSVPASCGKPPNPITDSNNFAYSNCGLAQTFRVNWAVNQPPNIEHNGDEPGLSGSNTRLDQKAATAEPAGVVYAARVRPSARHPVAVVLHHGVGPRVGSPRQDRLGSTEHFDGGNPIQISGCDGADRGLAHTPCRARVDRGQGFHDLDETDRIELSAIEPSRQEQAEHSPGVQSGEERRRETAGFLRSIGPGGDVSGRGPQPIQGLRSCAAPGDLGDLDPVAEWVDEERLHGLARPPIRPADPVRIRNGETLGAQLRHGRVDVGDLDREMVRKPAGKDDVELLVSEVQPVAGSPDGRPVGPLVQPQQIGVERPGPLEVGGDDRYVMQSDNFHTGKTTRRVAGPGWDAQDSRDRRHSAMI